MDTAASDAEKQHVYAERSCERPSKDERAMERTKTEGKMKDGWRFTIIDDWTEAEKGETNDICQTWTGVTTSMSKTPDNKPNIMHMKQDYDALHHSQS